MHERRNFLTAVGTTLLGVGLAGFFAYYVAQSALSPKLAGRYPAIPLVAEIVGMVGIGCLIAFWVSHERHRDRQRELNDFLETGILLHRRLSPWHNDEAESDGREKEVRPEFEEWSTEVDAWLLRHFPEYQRNFINPAGEPWRLVLFGSYPEQRLLSLMDLRLERLRDVQMKL
jgi:hypothetical protein